MKASGALTVSNKVTKIAVGYGIMWLLSFWIQNIIYSTIISGFGVVLLIVVAIGIDGVYVENEENSSNFKVELEKLRNEIAELKNG
jgi:hypothetical protein